jgi:ribulose-phosphate 3-epimerase
MSRRQQFLALRASAPAILPSLLMCDFGHLAAEIARVEDAGAPALHLDVMDGHFVPNLTYGLPLLEAIRKLTQLPLDVHLMISNPGDYLSRYAEAGADCLTIHAEAVADPLPLLHQIRALDVAAGLAINPPTPLAAVSDWLDACDLLLVMSVMPGFGGQSFDPVALEKLSAVAKSRHPGLLLEVDGGVNAATIAQCGSAGAQLMVVGSAIFKTPDYHASVRDLAARAASAIVS